MCAHAELLRRVWLCDPMGHSRPGSSVLGLSRQEHWCLHFFLRGSAQPGRGNLESPELQVDSFLLSPPGQSLCSFLTQTIQSTSDYLI